MLVICVAYRYYLAVPFLALPDVCRNTPYNSDQRPSLRSELPAFRARCFQEGRWLKVVGMTELFKTVQIYIAATWVDCLCLVDVSGRQLS